MACGEIHKNDIGTPFEITMNNRGNVVNLSGVSSITLEFYKPNGDTLTVTPSMITNGTDGEIRYTFSSGDLDVVGMWKYQVKIVKNNKDRASNIRTFRVYENL